MNELQKARFWAKVDVQGKSLCWEWRAALNNGYGVYATSAGPRRAHRIAYEILRGPLTEGLTLDHLCRNRSCCNPWHLEEVTRGENVLRGEGSSAQRKRQTHCVHGHEFSPDNTYVDSKGFRHCRSCGRERARKK